ncbi:RluA family pseudouridine synthase [Tranquillimonas alkanivorans]|uniref:Pseudouridine synthase n=1 Tax=Tranquillimonas alkanivorans TaxID=441119 RepID=A0A1I5SXW9_9RHOB|nr:RluA family pseudouridine synthase [Tranquillimonas alkanivorans]SFP75307.1 ribosomal large subunit pseudouridine synthase C [Tranquillimonas alkanivorans]
MSGVQTLTVGPDEGDQRLDRWFRRHFPHVPQGRVEKMCRKGEIRVDGGRVKGATRLEAGQTVRVPPLPDAAAPAPDRPKVSDADAEMIRRAVIYRDDHVIALNKPPGLPTQGGSKQTRHVDGLAEALRFDYDEKPRLVHRLDKDTSGVLLLARTRAVAGALTEAFRARETRKIYWAAVAGAPQPRMGTVRFGLVKAPGHGAKGEAEKMLCIHPDAVDDTPGAKRATTDYAVLSNLGTRASWVALVPVTGRTHQLRAHMAELGHPIVGDGKYGGSGQENLGSGWGAQLGGEISRKLHLHARSIRLRHPVTGATLNLTAPLPEHMQRTWDALEWRAGDVPDDPFEEEA